ncbi:5-methylcytosine-specific restriction endonuclease McrBC regulatory subunit McrC [Neobacillus niacini]|nr:5-methylcytosine-specific restriction endonuclease McrBC regulatory subunit McrC [Neobacillus niacini]
MLFRQNSTEADKENNGYRQNQIKSLKKSFILATFTLVENTSKKYIVESILFKMEGIYTKYIAEGIRYKVESKSFKVDNI